MTQKTDTTPVSPPTVVTVKDRADFDARLAAAPGPVLVDFVAADCGACEGEEEQLQKLATDCPTTPATILVVDESKVGAELANEYNVDGTPTLLYAQSKEDFSAKRVTEVDPSSSALRRKLKCAR